MNKFKRAALDILSKSKKPLHSKEITRLALEKGILETDGATPEASMNAQLSTDFKRKGKNSDFKRVSPSTYCLNEKRSILKVDERQVEDERQEEEKLVVEGGFTGKAGEHLVCSELLFRGFNACIMSVDVGMDIIATKDNKLFSVQVKTANLNQFNTYVFDVKKVSFERHDSGNIYYVFVLRGDKATNFLILPFLEMEKKVHEKAILEVNRGSRYRVNIKIREEKIYLGTKNHEMSYYLNNWSIVR